MDSHMLDKMRQTISIPKPISDRDENLIEIIKQADLNKKEQFEELKMSE